MNTIEKNAIRTAVDLISIAVRTAPKSGGVDDIICFVANDAQKKAIVRNMMAVGQRKARSKSSKEIARARLPSVGQAVRISWESDAMTVERSQGLILIGVRGRKPFGANCTCCGYESCSAFRAQLEHNKKKGRATSGPFCVFKIWDQGIAIASAAKTASLLNVDNRIMYRIGIAALQASALKKHFFKGGFIEHVNPILGLPLSASGKNIYFDRLDKLQAAETIAAFHHKPR